MTDPTVVLADFEEFKPVKTRKSVQIICEIPEERADAALAMLGGYPQSGESRPVAIALLTDDAASRAAQPPETQSQSAPQTAEEPVRLTQPTKERRPWHELSAMEQAGIRCNEGAFQAWLEHNYPDVWRAHVDMGGRQDVAAGCIRWLCGRIKSRASFAKNVPARNDWQRLEHNYRATQHGQDLTSLETARDGGRT